MSCHGVSPCSARYSDAYASRTFRRFRQIVGESGNAARIARSVSSASSAFGVRASAGASVSGASASAPTCASSTSASSSSSASPPPSSPSLLFLSPSPDCVSMTCTTSTPSSHILAAVSSRNLAGSLLASSIAASETPAAARYSRSLSCQLPGSGASSPRPSLSASPRVTYVAKKASARASSSRYQILESTGWSAVVSSISLSNAPPLRNALATTTTRAEPAFPPVRCARTRRTSSRARSGPAR